ncbi:hypothetical protein LXA43DRAFT_649191 [Ganoderma leucocontextum]|nr:hypothetical protein LXA43DRAFT_649191 [Ganoderma leucocontextum]
MADVTVAPNKIAMSRALGAAFLNHQVEQLEKSVHTAGNWRERRSPDNWRAGAGETKRSFAGPKVIQKRREDSVDGRPRQPSPKTEREHERSRRSEEGKGPHKDADVVVVDATVLIHGLYHLKKWCRDGREEVVIVPLEALNTLDLLKKGTSALAQRARAASRILEAQVGTNPRIRVQRDDAFVLWDDIPFEDHTATAPEWVRRTICCARWELEHVVAEVQDKDRDEKAPTPIPTPKPRVVLAVVSPPTDTQPEAANSAPISASPVPLPAPQPNRYESRLSAALVARWATKAGVQVIEVTSAPPHPHPNAGNANGSVDTTNGNKGRRSTDGGRRSGEEERGAKRAPAGRGRRNSRGGGHPGQGRVPQNMASGTGLVERPQAVMTMMEMVTQPNRVVRVLARGEKLDP